ncbi:MAG TPA: LysM domain-containing protein [Clostridia bacterium]|nr:LysM domain-containing protein [Clostridia bacterium]
MAFFYNTIVSDIIKANPGISPNQLQVGQQLCVPMKTQLYPACPTTNYYVVASGDTMESIAEYFGISSQQLLYSNYGIDLNDLYKDQAGQSWGALWHQVDGLNSTQLWNPWHQ